MFARKYMELEIIMLSELIQAQDKGCTFSLMWKLDVKEIYT
jgi:hypothetical protein